MQGLITEVNRDKAIFLSDDGQFKEIKNRNYRVGQTVTAVFRPAFNYAAAIAACLLLCISGLSGYRLYATPTSYVYVDINPSLRLDINYFNRVISVVPLNYDAKVLSETYELGKKNAPQCVEDIITRCEQRGYLDKAQGKISVEIMTDRKTLSNDIKQVVGKYRQANYEVEQRVLSLEENNQALFLHVSARKLKAVQSYTDLFGGELSDNVEKLREASIDDIYTTIETSRKKSKDELPAADQKQEKRQKQDKEIPKQQIGVESQSENKPDEPSSNRQAEQKPVKPEKMREPEKKQKEEKQKDTNQKEEKQKKKNKNDEDQKDQEKSLPRGRDKTSAEGK